MYKESAGKGREEGTQVNKNEIFKEKKSFKENSENDKIWKMLKYYCLFSRA